MDNSNAVSPHSFQLSNREKGTVTGVVDVLSFDDKLITLATSCGRVTIKGNGLHVRQLNLEKGQVDVEGQVDTIAYSEDRNVPGMKKETVLGRLFK